ncbi:MAG TPA: hypothetical protein VK919_14870 [Solirubrobacterales bacterium]|nr:hypothetical protein [Solirubrobacterales bacterium]
MNLPPNVAPEEWEAARRKLLTDEKDITALGRQEEWEDSPEGYPQTPPYQWWNLHDEYAHTG